MSKRLTAYGYSSCLCYQSTFNQAGKKPKIAREPEQIFFKIFPRDPEIIPRNPKIFPQDPKFLKRESKILSKLIHTTSVMGKMTALINS